MTDKFLVSTSPHIRSDESIPKIMWTVVFALVPAAVAGCWFFGWQAVAIIIGSIVMSVATEAAILAFRRKPLSQALDGSAIVTGLLFAMVISSNVSWYLVVIGAMFSIAVAKHLFGGLGYNIWNPALAGRAFVLAAWSLQMTSEWASPRNVDAVTKATALNALKMPVEGIQYSIGDLFFGNVAGSLGETSALLLLIGGIYLIARKYVDWRVPVSFVVTAVVLCMLIPFKNPEAGKVAWYVNFNMFERIAFWTFSGGLILGAFFMATDMVTSPMTKKGGIIFGVGCGVLTAVIRKLGGYPEGVCYSILIMNTAVPLIDRFTVPKKFGSVQPEKAS
jgi:electron transport complex protein RnfD